VYLYAAVLTYTVKLISDCHSQQYET